MKCPLCVLILCPLLLATPSAAKPILTITCYAPAGNRFDFGPPPETWLQKRQPEPVLTEKRDGYTGVNPVFIIDSDRPKKMTVIWGDTKTIPLQIPEKASEADILLLNENQITSVQVFDRVVHTNSFFPKRRVGYFSSHSINLFDVATAKSMAARCEFVWDH